MTRLAVALVITPLVIALSATAVAEPRPDALPIAPLDEDLASMRRTLERLESLINDRDPDEVEGIIAPETPAPRRQEMLLVTRAVVDALPAKGRFLLRTDIGRGALVPIGPERLQVQVRGTTVVGEERRGESVRLELSAVEHEGRRRWMLTGLEFPRLQGVVDVQREAIDHVLAAAIFGGLAIVVAAVVLLLRRRRRKNDENDEKQ